LRPLLEIAAREMPMQAARGARATSESWRLVHCGVIAPIFLCFFAQNCGFFRWIRKILEKNRPRRM